MLRSGPHSLPCPVDCSRKGIPGALEPGFAVCQRPVAEPFAYMPFFMQRNGMRSGKAMDDSG